MTASYPDAQTLKVFGTFRVFCCLLRRFAEQRLDGGLGFSIPPFANVDIAQMSPFVDQIKGWPIAVLEGTPIGAFVVLNDRVGHAQVDNGLLEVLQVTFMIEFRVMIADEHQALSGVLFMPSPQRGDHIPAINSAKSPHVQQNDLAAQACQAERAFGVQPDFVLQLGGGSQVVQGPPP